MLVTHTLECSKLPLDDFYIPNIYTRIEYSARPLLALLATLTKSPNRIRVTVILPLPIPCSLMRSAISFRPWPLYATHPQ